jgi:hypothetical protein
MKIKPHAQLQTIEGTHYEFQPEHLLCDDCWNSPSNEGALALANYYGKATASTSDENFRPIHSLTITVKR